MAAKKKVAKKAPAKKAAAKKVAKKAPAKKAAKRKPNAAFMKPVTPNEKLAVVVGAAPLPRTDNLQDKKNRRMINADAALKVVFGGKAQVSMFDMTKLVSKNVK